MMDEKRFEKDAWYRAVPFADRLATLRAGGSESPAEADAALAERRLRRWGTEGPLADETLFAKRLAQDNLSEAQFRAFLGEATAAVRERMPEPPEWLSTLARAFSLPAGDRFMIEASEGQEMVGFLALTEPLLRDARRRLQE